MDRYEGDDDALDRLIKKFFRRIFRAILDRLRGFWQQIEH